MSRYLKRLFLGWAPNKRSSGELPLSPKQKLIRRMPFVQLSINSGQEWVHPTAVFLVTFYLCLEVLITKEVTNAIFTESAALLCLDALSKPWDCADMSLQLTVAPKSVKIVNTRRPGNVDEETQPIGNSG
jgi:hypothetical protein